MRFQSGKPHEHWRKSPCGEGLVGLRGCGDLLDVYVPDFVLVGIAVSSGPSFDAGFNDFPT